MTIILTENTIEKDGIIYTKRKHCMYNNEFRIIDSEIKAYFLGFLFADGSLYQLRDGTKARDYGVRSNIHNSDGYMLYKIKETFPFFRVREITYHTVNIDKQTLLEYSGRFIYEDLKLNGLIERKSNENRELLKMPELPEGLVHHFIRGYFDGNGSISTAALRPNLRRVDIVSAAPNLMNQFYNWFKDNGCPSYPIRVKLPDERSVPMNILEWVKSEYILKLRDLLYKDATIFLNRKKNIFDSFVITDKVLDRGLICNNCGCNKIRKSGTRGLKIRYKCSSCLKGFSLPVPIKKSDELLESPKAVSTSNSDNLTDETMDNQQPSME